MGGVAWADDAASRNLGSLQDRRASLQRELVGLQSQIAQAEREVPQIIAAGSATAISSHNRKIRDYRGRMAEIQRELGAAGSLTAGSTTAGFSSGGVTTPGFKRSTGTTSIPSFSAGPSTTLARPGTITTTAPAINKLDEGLAKLGYKDAKAELGSIEDFRSSESVGRRRGGVSALGQVDLDSARRELERQQAQGGAPSYGGSAAASGSSGSFSSTPTAIAPGTGSATSASNLATNPNASLGALRGMDNVITQRKMIGWEQDAIHQEMVQKQREQAALVRMNQNGPAGALQSEINDLGKRLGAAQAEAVRIDRTAQALADEMVDPDENVGATATQSGLKQLRGAGVSDDGRFKPGDEITVIVAEDGTFNGTFPVMDRGAVMPGIGRVNVIGMGEAQAETLIKSTLEETMLQVANVTVQRKAALRAPEPGQPIQQERWEIIYLAGEFITPGPLRIPDNVSPTLLQTIIRSGGITPSGDLTRVKLLRIIEGVGAVEEINVSAILSGQVTPTDIVLQDGDIVVIPPFAPVVYVTGNVERPGTLRLFQDETLTAYAAILRAGGFARFANLRKVFVVRDLGNGEKANIPINIRDIQKGKAPDVILQGKDIVVVPERFFSF
jgi:protein involved in polysaccharide export with SLBB domain